LCRILLLTETTIVVINTAQRIASFNDKALRRRLQPAEHQHLKDPFPEISRFKPGMRMGKEKTDHRFTVDAQRLRLLGDAGLLPSRLFRIRELLRSIPHAPVIKQKKLIQTLHYLNFSNTPILILMMDLEYEEDFLVPSQIESCTEEEIRCRWPQEAIPTSIAFTPLNLIVDDGLSLILFPIHLIQRHETGFSAAIPKEAHLLGKRQVHRHVCRDIDVVLIQDGFVARGKLVDFSPMAFRVRVEPDTNSSFVWMNTDSPCAISLYANEKILFSRLFGRRIRQKGGLAEKELVFSPIGEEIRRFQKRKVRPPRLGITPPLIANFTHPFTQKPIQRDIHNLSFAGFSVEETAEEGVLMPGMIIPNLEIRYAGVLKMICDAQVIYRRKMGKGRIGCGLAILDMDFRAYRQLSHIMVHAGDPQACFASHVQLDNLWEFLFDTGFIYPKKYHFLKTSIEDFKETYRKLYQEDQEIEAHFTYQNNGRIYGHVSIFQAYQRAWMVHHLAARPLNGKHVGLTVLKNVLRFFDGLYRYPSIRIDHMLFYFRPENHFPNLFFGGFARDLGNQRACSLDLFAYMSHPTDRPQDPFPQGWRLIDFEPSHLPELERFYRNVSGGLLLDVLRLGKTDAGNETLEEVYRRQGFLRQWRTYALLKEDSLKAVLVVNHSSPGLNLSEFLNNIKVVVTDPIGLPWEVLNIALARLAPEFQTEIVPLLIYPANYPSERGLKVDKHYLLWILDTQYGKEYLDYMEEKTKINLRFLVKHLLRKMVSK
jgi:hypothetical protein